MNLESSLYRTDKFVALEPIIENVKEDISFWGIRYVYIQGSKDRFPIDILAKRVIELIRKTNFEFTDKERAAGEKIAIKIDRIYEDNDLRLQNKWFITRILCYISDNLFRTRDDIVKGIYDTRFYWKEGENTTFDFYTDTQFLEKFNYSPNKESSNKYRGFANVSLYPSP